MNEMYTNEFMLNVAERVVSTRFNAIMNSAEYAVRCINSCSIVHTNRLEGLTFSSHNNLYLYVIVIQWQYPSSHERIQHVSLCITAKSE